LAVFKGISMLKLGAFFRGIGVAQEQKRFLSIALLHLSKESEWERLVSKSLIAASTLAEL
jgi:hypothetical protein